MSCWPHNGQADQRKIRLAGQLRITELVAKQFKSRPRSVSEDFVVSPCQIGTHLLTSGTLSVFAGAQVGNGGGATIDIRALGFWSNRGDATLANDTDGRIEITGGLLQNRPKAA